MFLGFFFRFSFFCDDADAGGSGIVSRRVTGQPSGADQFVMKVANNRVGLVIGKGGETIKNMQARTGAQIQVIPLHLPPGDTSSERTLQIDSKSASLSNYQNYGGKYFE